MFKYTKFLTNHVFLFFLILGMILGGHWLWLGFFVVIIGAVLGDFLLGDHGDAPHYKHPLLLNLIMYSYLPAVILTMVVFFWMVTPGDLFSVSKYVSEVTGYDAMTSRESNQIFDLIGAGAGLGIFFGVINTVMAHELIHRTWNPVAMFFGRSFFALAGGLQFETEHVYGHHITLGQPHDASLSLRGDNYYDFLFSAPFKQFTYAWGVEKERLAKYDHSEYWPGNKVLRSFFRWLIVIAIVFSLAGLPGLGVYAVACLIGKMIYECVGYQFHHGPVCVPSEPDGDRHSWNCNRLMTQVMLFNVSKHSEHHKFPDRPFYELSKVKHGEAPLLKTGCLTNALLCFIPRLQRYVIGPQIHLWDKEWATNSERQVASHQNMQSGFNIYQNGAEGSSLSR
jgi:alkane 1-monooxygenase